MGWQDRYFPAPKTDDAAFRSWYTGWASKLGLDPDPDDPRHKYDYRAAFEAGAQPARDPASGEIHWPSQFKADDHPNRFVGIIDTKTGKPRPIAGGQEAVVSDPEDRERTLGDYGNRFLESVRTGAANLLALPGDVAKAAIEPFARPESKPLPDGARITGPGRVQLAGEDFERTTTKAPDLSRGEVAEEALRQIREQNEKAKEAFRSRQGSPLATAALDTLVEGAAVVADPTNFLPAGAAVKAARVADDAPRWAARFLPDPGDVGDEAFEAVEALTEAPRMARVAPAADLLEKFPDATVISKVIDGGHVISASRAPRIALPPEGGVISKSYDIATDTWKRGDDVAALAEKEVVAADVAAGVPVPPKVLERHPELSAPIAVGRSGEAGFVRVPTGPGFLDRWFKKDGEFQALGELRGWAFDERNAMQAEIAAGQRKVADTLRDWGIAFERQAASGEMGPDETLDYVMRGLAGENDLAGVTPELREATQAMRAHLDSQSDEYLKWDELPGTLRETIEKNKGSYLPRSFEAFDNPDWKAIVDPSSTRHDPREKWRWDNFIGWAQKERDTAASQFYRGAQVVVPDVGVGRVVEVDGHISAMRRAMKEVEPSVAAVKYWDAKRQAARGAGEARLPGLDDNEALVGQQLAEDYRLLRPQAADPAAFDAEWSPLFEQRGIGFPPPPEVRAAPVIATGDKNAKRAMVARTADEWRQSVLRAEANMEGQAKGSLLVEFDTPEGKVTQRVARADARNIGGMGAWTDDEITAYAQRLLDRDSDAFLAVAAGPVGRESRGNLLARIRQDPRIDDLPTDLAQAVQAGKMSMGGAIDAAKQRPGWMAQYLEHAPGMPQEIDDLLGLYRDPSVRYKIGATRAIHDQAVHRLHKKLAEAGMSGDRPIFHATPQPGAYVKIGGKGPMAELHASPEVAAVIRATESTSKEWPKWAQYLWQKPNGIIKLAKTAGNFPAGHIRNLVAWPFQLLAGGHFVAAFDVGRAARAVPLHVANQLGTKQGAIVKVARRIADSIELADGTKLGERWAMDLKALRPEIEHLYRQGVLGQSAGAADLKHYMGVAGLRDGDPRRVLEPVRKVAEVGVKFWAGGDDLGKHIYYRAELQNLLWAEGKLGPADALPDDYFLRPEFAQEAAEAAKRVRLVTPTSSMVAPGIRALRDAPVAPFPSWTAEVIRNNMEQLKIGYRDLRSSNPRMKVLGAKRLAGLASAASLAGGGLGAAISAANNVTGEQVDAMRQFVPPWSRNSQLAITDTSGGKIRFVDLSSLIPQAAILDPILATLRGLNDPEEPNWDAMLSGVEEAIEPFVAEEIMVTATLDMIRNKKMRGGGIPQGLNALRIREQRQDDYPVYTPGASAKTQGKQVGYHLYKAAAPGMVLQGERLTRASSPEAEQFFAELTDYDRVLRVEDEAMGAFGLRFSTIDVDKSVQRLTYDLPRQLAAARALYARRSKASPPNSRRQLEAKDEANKMWGSSFDQYLRYIDAARKLGKTDAEIRRIMKDAKVSKKIINAAISGRSVPAIE